MSISKRKAARTPDAAARTPDKATQTPNVAMQTPSTKDVLFENAKLPKIVRNISACLFFLIFLAILVFSGSIDYACKHLYTAKNQCLFLGIGLIILAILAIVLLLIKKVLVKNVLQKRALLKNDQVKGGRKCISKEQVKGGRNQISKQTSKCTSIKGLLTKKSFFIAFITIGAIILLCIQCYIIKGAWFETNWDVKFLTHQLDYEQNMLLSYLSKYPNNIFLYTTFSLISKLGALLGMQSSYLPLVLGGSLCVTLAIWFCSYTAKSIFGYAAGYITFAISFCLAGLSPWILVPYSDAYGMLCPSLVLFCYCVFNKRKAKWGFISFFSLIGYFIKPTSIFILLSILLVEIYRALSSYFHAHKNKKLQKIKECEKENEDRDKKSEGKNKNSSNNEEKGNYGEHHSGSKNKKQRKKHPLLNWKGLIATALSFLLGLILAGGVSIETHKLAPELDSNKEFSIAHFLMMGANTQSKGVYSASDVAASESCPDTQTRKEMNIQTWKSRLQEMEPAGIAKLIVKKTITNFADGTFAWANEGNFWIEIHGNNESIKSFYGIGNFSHHTAKEFQAIAQVLWLIVLLGVCLGFMRKNVSKGELVAYLSLIALAAFLTIFECRARYLYLYLPYFIMLGSAGWVKVYRTLLTAKMPKVHRKGAHSINSRNKNSRATGRP